MMTADDSTVSSTIENADQHSDSIKTELYTLIEMLQPSEPNYNQKIQKVHSAIEMIVLKFQSLNLYYKGEIDEIHSQLQNRDMHIQLLEDALQEISTSYRTVVESNESNSTTRKLQSDRAWKEEGGDGFPSIFGSSSFSSLSSANNSNIASSSTCSCSSSNSSDAGSSSSGEDWEDESSGVPVRRVVSTAAAAGRQRPDDMPPFTLLPAAVRADGDSSSAGDGDDGAGQRARRRAGTGVRRPSRIPRVQPQPQRDSVNRSVTHSRCLDSTALAEAEEVRLRMLKLNQKIAEAQALCLTRRTAEPLRLQVRGRGGQEEEGSHDNDSTTGTLSTAASSTPGSSSASGRSSSTHPTSRW